MDHRTSRDGSACRATRAITRSNPADRAVIPRLAHLPRNLLLRFGVVHELLLRRVPLQLSPESNRDAAQMAQRHAAVPNFRRADRFAPGLHALDEVAHV